MTKPKVEALERRRVPSGTSPRAAIAPRPTAAVVVASPAAQAPSDPFQLQAMPVSVSLPGHIVEADRQAQSRLLEARVTEAAKAIEAFEGDFTRQLRARGITTRLPRFLDGLLNTDARDAAPAPDAAAVSRTQARAGVSIQIKAPVAGPETPAAGAPSPLLALGPDLPAMPPAPAPVQEVASSSTVSTGVAWAFGAALAAGASPALGFDGAAMAGAWGVFDLTDAPLLAPTKAASQVATPEIPAPPPSENPDPGLDAHAEVAAAAVVPDVPWRFEYAESGVPAAYDGASGLAWTQTTAWDDLFDTPEAAYDLSGEVGLFAWLGTVVALTVATEAARRKLGLTGPISRLRSKSRSKSRAKKRRRKGRRMMVPPAWAIIDELPGPYVDPGPHRAANPHRHFAILDDLGPEIPPPHVLDAELGSDFEIESLSEFEFELGATSRRFEYEYDLYLRPVEPGS